MGRAGGWTAPRAAPLQVWGRTPPPSIAQAPYSLRSLGGAPERQARRPAEARVRLHRQVVRWPRGE